MELPLRCKNALLRNGIITAWDTYVLIKHGNLDRIKNIGQQTATTIKQQITSLLEDINRSTASPSLKQSKMLLEIPTQYLDTLPIEVLAWELGKDLYERINKAGFKTVGELARLSDVIERFRNQDISKVIKELITVECKKLSSRLETGLLHPSVQHNGRELKTWAQVSSIPTDKEEQPLYLKHLMCINENNSIASELNIILSEGEPRQIDILLQRSQDKTLEEVGGYYNLSRERVRQIMERFVSKVWNKAAQQPCLYVRSAILWAEELGEQLSAESWRKALEKRNILGVLSIEAFVELPYSVSTFDILVALLRSPELTKTKSTFEIPTDLQFALSTGNLPIGVQKAIKQTPRKIMRQLLRKARFMGGIRVKDVCEALSLDENIARGVLENEGFEELMEGWYTFAFGAEIENSPIENAGLKMIEACGPLEFSIFMDGLRRHVSRYNLTLAPVKVVERILKVLGFELEDNIVKWKGMLPEILTESDKAFIEATSNYGPVVSFYEVVQTFLENNLSLPSATRVLDQSPIVEKLDVGFYKLRGITVTWEDIHAARNRQLSIETDPQISRGIDGVIRYQITVNSWALGGTLSISGQDNELPDLGKGWEIFCNGEPKGKANRNEYMIWGLASTFKALDIEPGNRVELAFDVWKSQIFVKKVTYERQSS